MEAPNQFWTPTCWTVQGFVDPAAPIKISPRDMTQAVHIKHCHGTLKRKATIIVKAVSQSFFIEHCTNIIVMINFALETSV